MGISLALLCAFFSSSKDIVSKRVSSTVSGSVSAAASFLFALPYYLILLFILGYLGYEDFSLSWAFLGYVVLRSTTDVFAEYFKMSAFRFGDLSLVAPFLSLTPFFLLMTSPLITGDRLTPLGVAGVLLVLAGNLSLLRGRIKNPQIGELKGVGLAICSSFFFSLNTCFDRLAVQEGTPVMSGFAMTLVAGLILSPALLRGNAMRDLVSHSKPFWLRGGFETAFMVSKLAALQYLQASYVDGIAKLSLIFSILAGRFIFKEQDLRQRLIAGGLVLSGALLIGAAIVKG